MSAVWRSPLNRTGVQGVEVQRSQRLQDSAVLEGVFRRVLSNLGAGRVPEVTQGLEKHRGARDRDLGTLTVAAERRLTDVDAQTSIAFELALVEPLIPRALVGKLGDASIVLEHVERLVAGDRRLQIDQQPFLVWDPAGDVGL